MDSLFPSYPANHFLLWLLLFVIMLHKDTYSLRVPCNEKDRHALQNFKKHTVVNPSAILSSWSDERDCCEWTGVQCDNTTGRVIKLNLSCSPKSFIDDCGYDKSHCLTGELHLSLLLLEFLNYLDLSSNDFHAFIQNDYVDITNSSNLHFLDLSYNRYLQIHDLHWLSRVSSLKYVNFSDINLQGKVDWIQLATLLPSLTELYLDGCHLRNIDLPFQFANFTSLEAIGLSGNDFSSKSFPDWLFNLSDVAFLDLSSNSFQGQIPNKLLNLRKLQKLFLGKNKLNGPIPDWLGQLDHLQVLDVGDNLFSGPIPSTLGNLSSLITFYVYSNHLNGSLPESLGHMLNLEKLDIQDNNFTGYVSERNFGRLSNLKYLYMGSPSLIFDFDATWIPPFQLNLISLKHMVGPKLPAWLYTQKSLSSLGITNSRISFESQDKFWDFAAPVVELYLKDNRIDADMSDVLLNSTTISLDSNKLNGSLPRLSPNVAWFSVANNSLGGSISSFLCQKMNGISQLKFLDMSNNVSSEKLTDCWMNWKSLIIVKLDNNNLTGTIPPSMSLLSNLRVLHLNKNNLYGEIPLSLKKCQNLQIFDISENSFSGSIRNWMGHNAKVLKLTSNQFSGKIPTEICQLQSLVVLDFADNRISGSIPICLYNITTMASLDSSHDEISTLCFGIPGTPYGFQDNVIVQTKGLRLNYEENLKWMRVIDLSSNNMSGTIPPKLFSLIGLRSLSLSHNQFEGNIPKEIGKLKQLESLDLASNQLSGGIPQTLAAVSSLAFLNLSFNNFSGKIPSGTQLQGFDPLNYAGNPNLCGAPLQNCTDKEDMKLIEENGDQVDEFLSSFYIGMGVGFATAFWIVCGAIFFNRNFRHFYFRLLYGIRDKLYVIVVLQMNFYH